MIGKYLLSVSRSGVREGEESKRDTTFSQATETVESSLTLNRNTLERAFGLGRIREYKNVS